MGGLVKMLMKINSENPNSQAVAKIFIGKWHLMNHDTLRKQRGNCSPKTPEPVPRLVGFL